MQLENNSSDGFAVEAYDDPHDFIRALRRTENRWCDGTEFCTWYFRGQRNSNWKIVPSGFRFNPATPLLQAYLHEAERWTVKQQLDLEELIRSCVGCSKAEPASLRKRLHHAGQFAFAQALLVRDFVLHANYAGHSLTVPNELYLVGDRHFGNAFRSYVTGELLSNNETFVSTLAIAQHHGIPTALVDWTYDPLAAVFFAAERAIHYNESADENYSIAVFCVHRKIVESNKGIQRITLSPGIIDFLDAQEGLFLWSPDYYNCYVRTGEFPAFDTVLKEVELDMKDSKPLTVKLTLPARHAREVLRLLWREKISPAHIRPTLDNVTTALEMRTHWLHDSKVTEPDKEGTMPVPQQA
jgi:hypothetical protein